MTVSIIVRRIKNFKKKNKLSNPTGGDIERCIEPDSVYEVVHPVLELVIKQMLGLPPQAGPIIISVPVLILAYLVSQHPIKQLTILGVSVFADQIKDLFLKTVIGIGCGSIFFFTPVGIVSLTGALLGGAIFFNIAQGVNHIECNDFVLKLPSEKVSEGKTVSFLQQPPEKNSKVFIRDNEKIDLYYPRTNDNKSCSSEYKQFKIRDLNLRGTKSEPKTQITRKCKKEFVLLPERTKTFSDLREHDSTANLEKVEPFVKRYEDRRKRIRNQRIYNDEDL
jgi:hypothetical protein